MSDDIYPLLTRDPASGGEFIVTRLECPESGTILEGRFSLGWVGQLTPEQLDFVGYLLRNRNNVQKVATELGVAYNTARARLDEVVEALSGVAAPEPNDVVQSVIDRLASGEASFEDALEALQDG